MHRYLHPLLVIPALIIPLFLEGCVVPGAPYYGPVPCNVALPPSGPPPPYYGPAYGGPSVVIAPAFYPNYGYGYWYGNRFCGYRNGYYFRNGCYYRGGPRYYNNGHWCGPNNNGNWNRNYRGQNWNNNGNWNR